MPVTSAELSPAEVRGLGPAAPGGLAAARGAAEDRDAPPDPLPGPESAGSAPVIKAA